MKFNTDEDELIREVQTAIALEIKKSPKHMTLKVIHSHHDGTHWRVRVRAKDGGIPEIPDHSRYAWWDGPPQGRADLEQIVSGVDMVVLKNATARPPNSNGFICVDLPNFLEGLEKIWADKEWAAKALACVNELAAPQRLPTARLHVSETSMLRPAQRAAFGLVSYSSSYLWGPPGTGKTTALAAVVAEFLGQNPDSRVLLLSTTNFAVDEVTVRVDMELEQTQWGLPLRRTIQRFGPRFNPRKFLGRTHLIADRAGLTIEDGSTPESNADSSPVEFADIARSDEFEKTSGHAEVAKKPSLESARLVAMTLAGAIASMDKLRALRKFDLLVFDEASQIGLANVLAMMPLAHIRLFAGDPIQLSPIARAARNSPSVANWLARSPFAFKPDIGPALCQLVEQSRMPPLNCEIVSEIFYGGRLRVADNALVNNPDWLSHKKKWFGPIPANANVFIHPIQAATKNPAKKYERRESALAILSLLNCSLTPTFDNIPRKGHERVLVLTPFRDQQHHLRTMLDEAGFKQVRVSTVHSVQGSEAEIVIFDPVDGTLPFLMNEIGGPVVNVAISRATSKLILMLSESDLTNPLFAQMDEIVNRHANRPIKPIFEVLSFPGCEISAVGQRVSIGKVWGEIISIHPKFNSLVLIDEVTQRRYPFDYDSLLAAARNVCV